MSMSGYFRGGFGASRPEGPHDLLPARPIPGPDVEVPARQRVRGLGRVRTSRRSSTRATTARSPTLHFMPTRLHPDDVHRLLAERRHRRHRLEFATATGAVVYFPNLYVDIKGIPWLGRRHGLGGHALLQARVDLHQRLLLLEPVRRGRRASRTSTSARICASATRAFAVDGDVAPGSDATAPPLPIQSTSAFATICSCVASGPGRVASSRSGSRSSRDFSNDIDATGKRSPTAAGASTVQYVQQLLGGDNRLALQYGRGGGTGFGTLARFYYPDFSLTTIPKESRFRVVDVFTIQPPHGSARRWASSSSATIWEPGLAGRLVLRWRARQLRPHEHFKLARRSRLRPRQQDQRRRSANVW